MNEKPNPGGDLELAGERVLLRRPRVGDVPGIVRFYEENREHLRATEPDRPRDFYSQSWWEVRVAELERGFVEDRLWHNLLFLKEHPEHVIGVVNFFHFVRGALQACTLGYALAESMQRRGLMTEGLQLGISHVLGPLRMHRIVASYLPSNIRSAVILARLGFVPEGYARRFLRVQGHWQDYVMTSLISEDWQPPE